ncbi:MAG: L,D-transpeptidase [Patescibacteria group bacterium]|nr:L,D-transpeptidase [Patescibacteria group bacterium]
MKNKIKIISITLLFLLIFNHSFAQDNSESLKTKQFIHIHLKNRLLDFFENDSLILQFQIRIGKSDRPTPIGEGYIYKKRISPIFRYSDPGPEKGKIIIRTECADGIKKVNYKLMRALGLHYVKMDKNQKIIKQLNLKPQGEERYSIHSVTCSETIGQAVSKGCIGLRIADMLELFTLVKEGEYGTKFIITDD